MKLDKEILKINKILLICFFISAGISATVAQILADQEDYVNTTSTIVVGYVVFFGFFGILFYFDNKRRYSQLDHASIKNELLKLISSLGVGEFVYIFVRWTLQFHFLGINFEPFLASLLSEAIATLFYLVVVSMSLGITKKI